MDPRLSYARELEQRDAEVAGRVEHMLALGRGADELRTRAQAVATRLVRLPEDRERVSAAVGDAERMLASVREALADAETAASREASESDRRRRAHAATEVRAAEERRARLVDRVAALEREEQRLRGEGEELIRVATNLAGELDAEPRIASPAAPPADLPGLKEWASRTHAAVLIARSGLESERDRIVREANELASAVVGETLQATSTASIREQLERILA